MEFHEINIFSDLAKAEAKAAQHKAAGRKNVVVRPPSGYPSLIVYDHTAGQSTVIFDADGPPPLYLVESDGT